MDEDPRDPGPAATLGEVTTSRIVNVSVDAAPDEISQSNADWVVLRGEDQGIVGLITPATAARAARQESINYLAQRTHFEVVPADLELGISRSPIAPELLVVTGLVIAVDDGEPVGVWAGRNQNQYVLLNRVEQGRFEPPGIVIGKDPTGAWNPVLLSHLGSPTGWTSGSPTDLTTVMPGVAEPVVDSCQYVETGKLKTCGSIWAFLFNYAKECANPRVAEGYRPHVFARSVQ